MNFMSQMLSVMSFKSFPFHLYGFSLGIYRFAEGHNIEGLRDISLSYIHDNFFLVSQVIVFIFVCV